MLPTNSDQARGDDPVRELFRRWGLRTGRVALGWTVQTVARSEAGDAAFAEFSCGPKQVRFCFRRAGAAAHAVRIGDIQVGHDALGTELNTEIRPLFGLVIAMLKRHDGGADLTPLLGQAPAERPASNGEGASGRAESRFRDEVVRIERKGGALHVQLLRVADDATVLLHLSPSGEAANAFARTAFGDVSYSRFNGLSEPAAADVARRYARLLESDALPWPARYPHLVAAHADGQQLVNLMGLPSPPAPHAQIHLDPAGLCALLDPEIVPDGPSFAGHLLRAVHWSPERRSCQLDFSSADSGASPVGIFVGPPASLPDAFAAAGALAVEVIQKHATLTDADAQLAAHLVALLRLKQRRDCVCTVADQGPWPSIPSERAPVAATSEVPAPSQAADWRHLAAVFEAIGAFRSAVDVGDAAELSSRECDAWAAKLRDERQRFGEQIARSVRSEWEALQHEHLLREGAVLPELAMPRDYGDALAAVAALERSMPDGGRSRVLEDMYLDSIPRKWVRQLAVSSPINVRLLHTPLNWERLPRLRRMVDALFAQIEQAHGSVVHYLGAPNAGALFASVRTIAELYEGSYWSRFMPLQDLSPTELAGIAPLLDRSDELEPVADLYLSSPLFHDLSHGRSTRVALFPPNLDECITAYLGVRAAPNLLVPEPGEDNALQEFGWYAQVGQALARVVGWDRLLQAYTGVQSWSAVLSPALSRALVCLGWNDYFLYRDLSFHSLVYRPDPWLKLFFLSGAGFDLEGLDLTQLTQLPWSDIPPGSPTPLDEEIVRDGLRAMCVRHFLDGDWLRVGRRIPHATIQIDLAACRMSTESDPDSADPAAPAYFFPPALAAPLRADGIESLSIVLRDLAAIQEIVANVARGHAASTASFAIELRSRPGPASVPHHP